MTDSANTELREAAGQLLSIGGELSRLKGAIEEHAALAASLRGLAGQIGALSSTLETLPQPLQKVSERGEVLIESVQRSVRPAGELLSAMADLRALLTSFPAAEVIKNRVDELGTEMTGLSSAVSRSAIEVREIVAGLPSVGVLRGITEAIDRKIDGITLAVGHCQSQLDAATSKLQWTEHAIGAVGKLVTRLDQRQSQSEIQLGQLITKIDLIAKDVARVLEESKGAANATSGRLDVLERLARRSLFAILFGRDEGSLPDKH